MMKLMKDGALVAQDIILVYLIEQGISVNGHGESTAVQHIIGLVRLIIVEISINQGSMGLQLD